MRIIRIFEVRAEMVESVKEVGDHSWLEVVNVIADNAKGAIDIAEERLEDNHQKIITITKVELIAEAEE